MRAEEVDFDANATRPVLPRAWAAYERALKAGPAEGRAVEADARRRLATSLGCLPEEIVWTRGGSHANAAALAALAHGADSQAPRLVLSPLEHRASRQAAERLAARGRARLEWLRAGADGRIELASLAEAVATRPALVSLLRAHNETGVLQPVDAASVLARAAGVPLHLDAVQALGRLPLAWRGRPGCTLMSVAAHKVGGVGGIGALLVRADSWAFARQVASPAGPWAQGAAFAEGARSVSPALCAAFAAAAEDLAQQEARAAVLAPLRDGFERALERRLAALGQPLVCLGRSVDRLPNTALLQLPGVPAEGLLMALDLAGFATSGGAACSAGAASASPSLLAMGLTEQAAAEVLRVSLRAPETGASAGPSLAASLDRLADAIAATVARGRARR